MSVSSFHSELHPLPARPGALELRVQGRVSYHEAPDLREAVLAAVRRPDASALIVELSQVQRMDTAGVAVLVEGLLEGRKRGLRVFLCAPSESVIRIFRLAGLWEALDCCCSSPEELQHLLMQP